ncbi:MAG: hypothetical protein U5K43_11160 [Halofilum sp. (in: g-proteobacteria)]|nr:hypothetical protein [Halofilum sp. (in: g-proteobacteria)]
MLAAGAAVAAVIVRRRRQATGPGLSPEERARAERLLRPDPESRE